MCVQYSVEAYGGKDGGRKRDAFGGILKGLALTKLFTLSPEGEKNGMSMIW